MHGQVNWKIGFLLAIAAIVGGLIGSRISLKVDKAKLKSIFGVAVLCIAAEMAMKMLL